MIRKYHNHTLQTNPRNRGEEQHSNYKTPGRQQNKATNSLFPINLTAKLERTQSNALHKIKQTQNPRFAVVIWSFKRTANDDEW